MVAIPESNTLSDAICSEYQLWLLCATELEKPPRAAELEKPPRAAEPEKLERTAEPEKPPRAAEPKKFSRAAEPEKPPRAAEPKKFSRNAEPEKPPRAAGSGSAAVVKKAEQTSEKEWLSLDFSIIQRQASPPKTHRIPAPMIRAQCPGSAETLSSSSYAPVPQRRIRATGESAFSPFPPFPVKQSIPNPPFPLSPPEIRRKNDPKGWPPKDDRHGLLSRAARRAVEDDRIRRGYGR